jgi:dolichol-phosphate mannosyltransferase
VKTLSIVVPVYYNELNLPDTIPALLRLQDELPGYLLDLVFVDDGSGDGSFRILMEFRSRFPQTIQVVKLTRNFGSVSAVMAGFEYINGDCIGVIAADLQDPPELFLDMVRYWEKGSKATFAIRKERKESFLQKLFSSTYYFLLRQFALPGYPDGGFDFVLVDRQIIGDLLNIREKNTNLMALIYWLGYHAITIPYVRRARSLGKSRWTLTKKIKLFIDSFVSFSYIPIRLLSLVGFLFAVSSFLYGGFILFFRIFHGVLVQGWVSTIVVLSFASGLQMAMMGVLGEYLWRSLDESRKRPPFVVDEVHRSKPDISPSEK